MSVLITGPCCPGGIAGSSRSFRRVRLLQLAGTDEADEPVVLALLHHVQAGNYFADWREALRVQAGIVAQVEEQLGSTGIRHRSSCISQGAGDVTLLYRVVRDAGVVPEGVGLGISRDPKLRHEIANGAVEARAVVEARLDQRVEVVDAVRRAALCQRK